MGTGKQPGCAESLPRFPLALSSTFLRGVWLGKAGPWKMHTAAGGRGLHSLEMGAVGEQSPAWDGGMGPPQGSSKGEF